LTATSSIRGTPDPTRRIEPTPSISIPRTGSWRIISTGSFPNGIAVSPNDATLAVADYVSNRMLYYSFLRGPGPACSQCGTDPSHSMFLFATAGNYNPGNGGPDGGNPN
jgi:sugar lactone lactonase YvrE